MNGRVRGLLAPREVETCTLELLRATRNAADELGLPIVADAAYNIIECYEIVREHRMTPVWLGSPEPALSSYLATGAAVLTGTPRTTGLTKVASGSYLKLCEP